MFEHFENASCSHFNDLVAVLLRAMLKYGFFPKQQMLTIIAPLQKSKMEISWENQTIIEYFDYCVFKNNGDFIIKEMSYFYGLQIAKGIELKFRGLWKRLFEPN